MRIMSDRLGWDYVRGDDENYVRVDDEYYVKGNGMTVSQGMESGLCHRM